MFKPMPPSQDLFSPDILPSVIQAADTYAQIRRVHPVTFAAFRQSPWYHHGILSLEQSQLTVRSPYLDNEFVKTVYQAPLASKAADDIRLRLIRDNSSTLGHIPSDRGIGGSSGRVASAISRTSLEFTFKAEYAYDYGMPQWVSRLDHMAAPLSLHRLFLGRHKFLHYRVWYRDSLASYVKQMLLDERTLSRPYLNRKRLQAIVSGHLKGGQNHTTAIHKMLTLELVQRLFFDAR
jgi:asparagine synthase (glutamine-hydrolysing)